MELFLDPSSWAGLLTLVILEVVLGIDNLVFIAILSKKLPPCKQDKARLIGLSLALLMRLSLLSFMSWMATLTSTIISNKYFSLSGRDLILLTGGLFLLFKATVELHERLDNNVQQDENNKNYAGFWTIVVQIIILDAVFSLDSIVTAVGIVNKLPIMMMAVVIAMVIMLLASKPLINFINLHQTVVVLCLSFLLIIGIGLVSEALGFVIPKGYLYSAISFSIIIELFNQIARRNFMRHQSRRPMRQRAAEAILRMMVRDQFKNFKKKNTKNTKYKKSEHTSSSDIGEFKEEEKYMINGVLTLAVRSIRSIMTPRSEISWVNVEQPISKIRNQLLDTPHNLFPVCQGKLDEVLGIVRAKELLVEIENEIDVAKFSSATPPIIIPDTLDPINLLGVLRRSKGSLVIVTNEFGVVQGLITPLDVLEAIAGEFPDADETPDIITEKDSWLVKGGADLHSLQQFLKTTDLIKEEDSYASLAGLLISQKGELPVPGETIHIPPLKFYIVEATQYRINLVRITKDKESEC
ncbi:membrane protein [Buchnera aphidicola (Schlechtendalia chinensis)]|uniref:Membrane protein n=1 Tax=Buchnera aphidicola subsp. Schlechtendalia chinensis TaxID=118110 RepID=A0A172WDM2_BUCSC|nr:TerC family protein [Buchnera aphidicola]ANF17078.1 membrane protein [Buchnera aphidicola (Schlechtendalia chinensis)]